MQEEQELFQTYEVKNWDLSPRIYKILAASAIFNILALLVVAQSNLLTTKGCDSPLVNKVCQVLDTIYVGGTVLTTDTEYVSKGFEPTVLEDAEIIWVDQTGAEKFKYPDGYRALANPELMIPQEIPNADGSFPANIPGIPNPTLGGSTDLMNQPQVLPQNNPNAVTKMPDSPFTFENNPTVNGNNPTVPRPKNQRQPKTWKNPTIANKSPDKLPSLTPDPTADKTETKTPTIDKNETVAAVEINKEPMKKFASDVKVKFEKKEVDLSQNFKVVADGVLTKDGKLDVSIDKKTKLPKSRILKSEGDPQMIDVAEKAIAAIGDSGWLGYLRNLGVEKINFTIVQDNDNLQVIITSDLPIPERAMTVSSGLNGLILIGKNKKDMGEDEKVLLTNANALVNPQNTKQFVLNFLIPKATAQEMITRKLNEPAEKPTETKPNGSTAQIKDSNKNTVK